MIAKVRSIVQEKPAVGAAIGVAFVGLAVLIFVFSGGDDTDPPRDTSVLWYYDMNTATPFPVKDEVSKGGYVVEAPSGPLKEDVGGLKAGDAAGVRLMKFACGDCSAEQFDGYLMQMPPEEKQRAMVQDIEDVQAPEELIWIRAMDGAEWHLRGTDEGRKIINAPVAKCGKTTVVPCEYNVRH